jgi:peptidoglycan/LPS O-acetylase OafA/YrhL
LPNNIRFEALFGTGMLYYLYRTRISFTHWGAAISLALLIPLMFNRALAELAVAVLGGYLIFWFSFKIKALKISRFTNQTDISYGLYLYAWPVQNFVIWNYRDMNPWLLCLVTVVSAGCLAYASWVLVEKPWLDFAHRRRAACVNANAADRTA